MQRARMYFILWKYIISFADNPLFAFQYVYCRGCHQSCAAHQRLFIEIKLRVVMTIIQMFLLIVRANEELTARHFFLHERHISCAHRHIRCGVNC